MPCVCRWARMPRSSTTSRALRLRRRSTGTTCAARLPARVACACARLGPAAADRARPPCGAQRSRGPPPLLCGRTAQRCGRWRIASASWRAGGRPSAVGGGVRVRAGGRAGGRPSAGGSRCAARHTRRYLVDSGAQYVDGTTDVTRTVHLGEPTEHVRICAAAPRPIGRIGPPPRPHRAGSPQRAALLSSLPPAVALTR